MPKREKRTLPKECEGQRGPKKRRLEGRNLDSSALHQAQMVSVPTSMGEIGVIDVAESG